MSVTEGLSRQEKLTNLCMFLQDIIYQDAASDSYPTILAWFHNVPGTITYNNLSSVSDYRFTRRMQPLPDYTDPTLLSESDRNLSSWIECQLVANDFNVRRVLCDSFIGLIQVEMHQ